MCPRHLGAGAVITRSFARIHESNLKKQGVLALTFVDPADYDKVLETDRVSLHGLTGLRPEVPLTAVLTHADGSEESFAVEHTLNEEQSAWFRAGSALNLLREQAE
jgi:aconitate hydratase